jgi:hypothetical protein
MNATEIKEGTMIKPRSKNMNARIHRVNQLIKSFPEAANDDRLLLIAYWQVFDGIEIPSEVSLAIAGSATMPDTITRLKRMNLKSEKVRVS